MEKVSGYQSRETCIMTLSPLAFLGLCYFKYTVDWELGGQNFTSGFAIRPLNGLSKLPKLRISVLSSNDERAGLKDCKGPFKIQNLLLYISANELIINLSLIDA